MWQYFQRAVAASTMSRMAVAGRAIIQWLAEPHVLETDRKRFEAQLFPIAEAAQEWISIEEGMRLSRPTPPPRNVFAPGPPRRHPLGASARASPGGLLAPHARSARAHLIASELFSVLATLGHTVSAGEPGENVTTEGLDVHGLGVGSVLLLGDGALVRVTGLRNPCAQIEGFQVGLLRHVAYRSNDGAFVRRAEIMGVVLRGGADTVGDTIAVSLPPASSRPLERVWPNALHIRYRSPGTRTVRCPSSPAVSPMGQGRPATRCG